jgi:hypothetical protein
LLLWPVSAYFLFLPSCELLSLMLGSFNCLFIFDGEGLSVYLLIRHWKNWLPVELVFHGHRVWVNAIIIPPHSSIQWLCYLTVYCQERGILSDDFV